MTRFYMIYDKHDKTVRHIFTNRTKAIIYWNFIIHEENDYISEDQIEIIATNEYVNIDSEIADNWTDIDLSDKPLDTKINVKTELNNNNPIYEKFKNDAMKKEEDEVLFEKQRKENHVFMTECVAKIKSQFSIPLINLLKNVRYLENEFKNAHYNVKQTKKLLKKNEIKPEDFEQIEEKEKEIKKNLGSVRRKFTCMKVQSQSELIKLLKDFNFYYKINDDDHENENTQDNKVFIFSVNPYNLSFYLDNPPDFI